MSNGDKAQIEYLSWVRGNVKNQGMYGHIAFSEEEKPLTEALFVLMCLGFPALAFTHDQRKNVIRWRSRHDK